MSTDKVGFDYTKMGEEEQTQESNSHHDFGKKLCLVLCCVGCMGLIVLFWYEFCFKLGLGVCADDDMSASDPLPGNNISSLLSR